MDNKWKMALALLVVFSVIVIAALIFFLASFLDEVYVFGDKVAVIPVKGVITMEGCPTTFGGPSCAHVDTIKDLLKEADEDSSVKSIVLEINSGGGYVVASRELTRAVKATKKPVVAWIGEAGASGAYYAASGADLIVADEDSITGSIGVIMSLSHYYDLFSWLGINTTTIKSGTYKDSGSPYRPMTEEEHAMFQKLIDDVNDDFVEEVSLNRNFSLEYARSISDGSIYLGSRAKELGLVDELGGLEAAIDLAAELGEIRGKPKVQRAEPEQHLLDLLSRLSTNIGYGLGRAFVEAGRPQPNLYRSLS
ncbi:MAG: signal peptide peptidase SppA [Candidatus Altiarchaeota archaeon]